MKFDEARKIYQDLKRFEHKIPEIVSEMGGIGLSHFKSSFRNEGFEDSHLEKWKPREKEDKKRPGRAILSDSGDLKRSLRRINRGRFSVDIKSDLSYAKVHNEGLEVKKRSRNGMLYFRETSTNITTGKAIKVFASKKSRSRMLRATSGKMVQFGAYIFKMPKRQFIGYSHRMDDKIKRMINRKVKSVFA